MQQDHQAAYERSTGRRLAPSHFEAAEEHLLQDSDAYTDWLSAQCMGADRTSIVYVPSDADRLQELIDGAEVPLLVVLQRYPNPECAYLCGQELNKRFLAANQDRITQIACDILDDEYDNGADGDPDECREIDEEVV